MSFESFAVSKEKKLFNYHFEKQFIKLSRNFKLAKIAREELLKKSNIMSWYCFCLFKMMLTIRYIVTPLISSDVSYYFDIFIHFLVIASFTVKLVT